MNLGQIQAAVVDRGYSIDQVTPSIVNAVYREVLSLARWPFLEKQSTSISTTAGVGGYPLNSIASDWLLIDAVRIEQPAIQQYNNLTYSSPQEFRDNEHVDRGLGTPYLWTAINQNLRLYPIPDGVYQVDVDYIQQPPDLAASGDVPIIPLLYHDILVWGSVAQIAYRERDWIGQNVANTEKESRLKRMSEEYLLRQRQSDSHVKRSGYWDTEPVYWWTNANR